jgi:hypothetical protein
MDVGKARRLLSPVTPGRCETSIVIAVALLAGACNYRAGGRTSWNASRGSVAYLAEARGGVVGQLEGDPAPDDPNGWMIAPEFGFAVGVEEGDFRVRSSFALPSYKYVRGAWGAQMLVDVVGDFGADDQHGWGPELRLGLLREVSRRDYEMKLVAIDITAAHLFGDRDGWVFGLGGSFGHLDQKQRQLK